VNPASSNANPWDGLYETLHERPVRRKRGPVGDRVFACVLSALCMLGSASAHAQSQREIWNRPTPPFRIIDNVYYVGTAGLACYLITTPKGHILLDAALAESVPQVEHNIESLGFKLKDVRFLLNSHAHYDHSGGLAQLKQDTGATLVASEGDRSALEGGFYLGSETDHQKDVPPVKVDRTIHERERVTVGSVSLTANLTPGHTRGCTSWSMPVSDRGKRLRLLFFCSSTVAANRLVGPPQYPGIVEDYRKTFARAKKMHVDVFLAPHPEFFGMQEKRERLVQDKPNPFIDASAFPAFIKASEADFEQQLATQTAAEKPQ
jgi:metallo-beta-lactamase class B